MNKKSYRLPSGGMFSFTRTSWELVSIDGSLHENGSCDDTPVQEIVKTINNRRVEWLTDKDRKFLSGLTDGNAPRDKATTVVLLGAILLCVVAAFILYGGG